MATSNMIARACKTDQDLRKVGVSPSPLNAPHTVGEVEEEVDPFEQARAARWLRRERPAEWRLIADVLGLEPGKPLTRWPADPADAVVAAVCLGEAHADHIMVEAAQFAAKAAPEPPPAPVRIAKPRRQARPDWTWQDDALCRGEDLALFFGLDGERPPQRDVREREAKAICAQCPVRNECLDYALTRPEKYGLYGSLNEDERASERRRRMRRAATAGVSAVPDEKPCTGCGKTLPADAFYPDNSRKDGLSYSCRACKSRRAQVA